MTPGRASTLQLAVLLPAFLLGAGAAGAQTLTGTVSGRITDEQGGALPGAMVTLSGRTGPQTQVTDSIGQYRFPGVAPDLYIVKAELQGFRSKQQDGVELGIGKTIDVSLALAVGGVSETVDVIAERPIVDTSSTATDTTLSQDMLFSMPLSHAQPAVNILQYSPGVTDGSAFGGSANTGNALLLDGVDTRDPSTGSAWPFYDYNIIEEVQAAGLGQPAEYGGFTGIVVNTITKSGGNRFSFLGEHRYTDDGSWLFSDNTDQGVVADNPNLGLPARVLSLKDYTVQLGGPLRRDRLFFFGSVQRYEIHRKQTGPIRSEISPRFYGKLSFQPTPNDHLTVSFQYDQFNMRGGVGMIPGWAITSQDMTLDNDAPEHVWSAQYRKVVSPSTFFEAKVSGYSGYVDAVPVSPDAAHRDGLTGAWSGGAGFWQMADRSRNQANAAVSKYAPARRRARVQVRSRSRAERFARPGRVFGRRRLLLRLRRSVPRLRLLARSAIEERARVLLRAGPVENRRAPDGQPRRPARPDPRQGRRHGRGALRHHVARSARRRRLGRHGRRLIGRQGILRPAV